MRKLIFLILMVFVVLPAEAASPRQLPELHLLPMFGEPLTAAQVQFPDTWMLIYLSGVENIDRGLLVGMEVFFEHPAAGKVAVVVPGINQQALVDLRKKHEKLLALRWFADQDRSAAKAFGLAGTTMIMGMRGGAIQWSVAGSGMPPQRLRSLLADWLK